MVDLEGQLCVSDGVNIIAAVRPCLQRYHYGNSLLGGQYGVNMSICGQ